MMPNSTSTRMRRAVIGAVGVAAALAATASLRAPGASAATTTVKTGSTAFQLVSGPGVGAAAAAVVVPSPNEPVGWAGDISGASWISSKALPAASDLLGDYVYEAPLTLTQAATLSGSISADQSVTLALVPTVGSTITVGTFSGSATAKPVSLGSQVPAATYTVRMTVNRTTTGDQGAIAVLNFDDGVAATTTTSTTAAPEATAYHAFAQPIRVYDSRTGTGSAANGDGPLAFGTTRTISLTQGYLTPSATTKVGAVPAGATSATVTVTIDGTTASGFLTLFAGNASQPASSSINWFGTGQILANMNIVALAADGTIKVTAGGPGSAQVILDVLGYYSPLAPAAPATTTTTTVLSA